MFVDTTKPNRPKMSERKALAIDIQDLMRDLGFKEGQLPRDLDRANVADLIKIKEAFESCKRMIAYAKGG